MFYRLLITMCLLILVWFGANLMAQEQHDHDNADKTNSEIVKDEHNHEDDNDDENHDQHEYADEDSGVHEDHKSEDSHGDEEHSDELTVSLTSEAVKLAGITVSTVREGRINKTIELPGEIGFNEDRVAHIAPRFAGIAKQANFRVGDFVKEGEIIGIVESNESMNAYSISAPIAGWIIERHITPGEYVSEENSIYVIADLSTVWVNLAVYPKDAERVKKGQLAEIKVIGSESITSGVIEYITPIVDFRTRSLTARITLSNPDNKWRPGSFVQGTIATESGQQGIVVEKSAVQYLDEKSVVFVVDGANKFRPVEINTGDRDKKYIQVISGLKIGTEYVSTGAFELKAKIVTSNLDAHAGHGH